MKQIRQLTSAVCLVTTLFSFEACAPPRVAPDVEWLPLTRTEIVDLLGDGAAGEILTVETWRDALESADDELAQRGHVMTRFQAEQIKRRKGIYESHIEELEEIHAAGETVWQVASAPDEEMAMITMAGKGEAVHTLRLVVATDRPEAESEILFKNLGILFQRVYPDWPEARAWPKESLIEAWNMSPLVREESLENPDDAVVTEARGGIISSTVGVPPDIVLYTITTRDRCTPNSDRGNPFARIIC